MDVKEHARFVARVKARKNHEPAEGTAEVVGTVADRMRESLVPMFQVPWDERHPMTLLRTGRRVGKSEFDVRLGLRGAWENPKAINPIILPTAKQARLALWPKLVLAQREYFPTARVLESEMKIILPEGGTITVGGCEHNEDVVKWFGIPFNEAIIDECGNFKDGPLRALFDDAIWPGTMDYGGRATFSGNPGIRLAGLWFDWTNPNRAVSIPLYTGDARDNPYIEKMSGKTPMEFFEATLKARGWTWETATFVRMYLGQWAQDSGTLVYPYQAYKDVDGVTVPWNYAEELPKVTETGDPVDPSLWRYVIGMDIGFVHATTYVVLASHPAVRPQYFVHAEAHSEWLDEQKVERAIQLQQEFGKHGHVRIVIDPGGGGKNVLETLLTGRPGRPPIPAELAPKAEKVAAIRELRDSMIAGWTKFLPRAQPLVDEMSVLGWDEDKLDHDPNGADDLSDAARYAKRASAHYSYRPELSRPAPTRGSNAWHEAERSRLLAQFRKMDQSGRFNRRGRSGKVLLQ